MKKRLKDKLPVNKQINSQAAAAPEKSTAAETAVSGFAADMCARFCSLVKDLRTTIDGFDDEEFLRRGMESIPYQSVVKLVEIRDRYFATKHNIPESDGPDALLADFNDAIKEAWRKLGEKRERAEQLFPELAESLSGEWGNIKISAGKTPFQIELEELRESMDLARELRTQITAAVEANPDDNEAKAAALELDAAFEVGSRRLSELIAKTFRQLVVDIYEELNTDIENTGDAELIDSIADTNAAHHIRQYANLLAQTEPSLKNLNPDDKPEEIIGIFERTVTEARKKLKEKRAAAEKRSPQLKKEYPMNASYNKALADVLAGIKARDELAKALKTAPPEKRPEGLQMLGLMDQKIEEGEHLLAVEYEAFQNHARAIDALRDEVKLAGDEELKQLRQYLKDNPEEMKDLRKLLAEEFPE